MHSLIKNLTESDKIPFEGVGVGAHRFGQGQGGDVLGFLKESLIELVFVKKSECIIDSRGDGGGKVRRSCIKSLIEGDKIS